MAQQIFDLFGDPVPESHGRRGRPPHVATQENRHKVSMLLALGWNNERIAAALRITPPSLRKHYFSELKERDVARDRLTAALAMKLWARIGDGVIGAFRELDRFIEKNDLMTFGQTSMPRKTSTPAAAAEAKLGKKEAARLAARQPDTGSRLGELIAQRQKPN